MALESHVRTLLHAHDCVIIPEFGGFLTRYRPAHIHALQNTLVPPSKVLQFNAKLTSNDGLIAQEIMRREGVSFQEATALIAHRVAEMEAALAQTQRLVLEGIGVIHQDPTGTLQFTPEAGQNFLTDAFGLEAVVLDTVEAEEPEPVETPATDNAPDRVTPVIPIVQEATPDPEPEVQPSQHVPAAQPPQQPARKRRWLVAAVALPLVAAGVYFMRDHLPADGQAFGFLSGPSPVVKAGFVPRFPEEDIDFKDLEEGNRIAQIAESNPGLASIYFDFEENEMSPDGIRVVLNEETAGAAPEREKPPVEALPERTSNLDLYFVVGGAFANKGNADRLASQLQAKGFDAYVFGKRRGLHMVCYGSYTNRTAATAALKTVQASENPQAWLKRP